MRNSRPPCSHEDISSIFLNAETILFLHQIFYKGLQARMNNWPTLVLGIGSFKIILFPDLLTHGFIIIFN